MKKIIFSSELIGLSIVLIIGFLATRALFAPGFIPTHDGEYHIIRFWQFYAQLASGNFFPRWAADLNQGLGIPLFTFQYPTPNYIGSFFHVLGLSFVDSVKWTLGSGYLVAILFCYLWLRRLFNNPSAAIGAIVCSFVPYWFVDLYIRGSVGEVWAIAWVFATFYAISGHKTFFIALCTALVILTHNIMALIFIPILLIYTYIKYQSGIPYIFLGLGIASYFWIPALYEQKFVTGISPVNIFDYFPEVGQLLIPSWGSGFRGQGISGNEMSYQIGIIPFLTFLSTGILLVLKKLKNQIKDLWFAILFFVLAVFFMTPFSAAIWQIFSVSHFIQYPWRLLSIVIVVTPLLAATVTAKFRFGWALAVFAILLAYSYTQPVVYAPRSDTFYLEKDSFIKGTSSLGNATQTVWLHLDQLNLPVGFIMNGVPIESITKKSPTRYELAIVASKSGSLVTPIAYYPGWQATIDDKKVEVKPSSEGLVSFFVFEGNHKVSVWLGLTNWQIWAGVLSIVSLSVALGSFILRKKL